jgi:hypothetical protein
MDVLYDFRELAIPYTLDFLKFAAVFSLKG